MSVSSAQFPLHGVILPVQSLQGPLHTSVSSSMQFRLSSSSLVGSTQGLPWNLVFLFPHGDILKCVVFFMPHNADALSAIILFALQLML